MYVVYPSIFFPEEKGGYSIFFPGFEGATCGDTLEECYKMAVDWLGINLSEYYLKNEPLPVPVSLNDIKEGKGLQYLIDNEVCTKEEIEEKDIITTLIGFDLVKYIKDTEEKTVRKNVSIPSYLNEMGKSYNINFSQVLQNALKQELGID